VVKKGENMRSASAASKPMPWSRIATSMRPGSTWRAVTLSKRHSRGCPHGLDAIADQVEQHLFDHDAIGEHRRQIGRHLAANRDA